MVVVVMNKKFKGLVVEVSRWHSTSHQNREEIGQMWGYVRYMFHEQRGSADGGFPEQQDDEKALK